MVKELERWCEWALARQDPNHIDGILWVYDRMKECDTERLTGPDPKNPVHEAAEIVQQLLETVDVVNGDLNISKSTIPKAGSGVFTSTAIEPGKVIYRTNNLLARLPRDCSIGLDVCDYCFAMTRFDQMNARGYDSQSFKSRDVTLFECNDCHAVKYCSKKCQVRAAKAWRKAECKTMVKPDNVNCKARLMRRLLIGIKNETISPDELRQMNALTNQRCTDHKSGPHPDAAFGDMMGKALEFRAATKSALSVQQIADLYGRMVTNATDVYATYGGNIGRVVQPFTAILNHSCDPNAFVVWNDGCLEVRSTRSIPANTELLIRYDPPQEWLLERQKWLFAAHHFLCACEKCVADEKSLGTGNAGKLQRRRLFERHFEMAKAYGEMRKDVSTGGKPSRLMLDNYLARFEKLAGDDDFMDCAPLPSCYLELTKLYMAIGSTSSGLKTALKLYHSGGTVRDARYIHRLAVLTVIGLCNPNVIHLCVSPDCPDKTTTIDLSKAPLAGDFIKDKNSLAIVAYGYLYFAMFEHAHILGAHNKPGATFRILWESFDGRVLGRDGEPMRQIDILMDVDGEFERAFYRAQARMLGWAGAEMTKGITLDCFKDDSCWV